MNCGKIHIVIILICLPVASFSQNDEQKDFSISINGYTKYLTSVLTGTGGGNQEYYQDNLVHNRLNFKLKYRSDWSFVTSARTRLFYGDIVKDIPFFDQLVNEANTDYWDLSIDWWKTDGVLLNTNFDRLYLEYETNDWEMRLGRQRINWGITLLWNPNDLFNTYDFTDFDYEERPGSDAIYIHKYTGFTSGIDFAFKFDESFDEVITAFRVLTNKGSYDLQGIIGKYKTDIAVGGGWAGNIKNAGFKGEMMVFVPYKGEDNTEFSITLGIDHALNNGLFLSGGVLYNSTGSTDGDFSGILIENVTPKNLYPFRTAVYVNSTYPVNPILSVFLTGVYSPVEVHPLFLSPGVTVSIANNWDLDLLSQMTFIKEDKAYGTAGQYYYLRVKWSF